MKGKVALFAGARKPFEIHEYEIPQLEPKAALIKVSLANLCGSDMHMWCGDSPFPTGIVGGHEMTGRIHKLGPHLHIDSAGKPLKEGDRVVCTYFIFCGTCRPCLQGRRMACQNKLQYWMTGGDVAPHFRGAYGEFYYSPPGNSIFKVPDSLSDEMVAAANCALSQVIYGLSEATLRLGEAVVIQGAGGLGINATAVAKEWGAGLVIVVDRSAERLGLAKEFGADHVVNISEFKDRKGVLNRVRELTGGQGADVVMGLVGIPSALAEGLRMLVPGGRMVEVGNIGIGGTVPIDPGYMVLRGLSLRTVIAYEPWALAAALGFVERNKDRLPIGRILSHKFPFEKINEAFENASQGKVVRASLVFNG